MLHLSHLMNELRNSLGSQFSSAQKAIIRDKVDSVIEAGMTPDTIQGQLEHWQFINSVTTESVTFRLNQEHALEYLKTKEGLRLGEAESTTQPT